MSTIGHAAPWLAWLYWRDLEPALRDVGILGHAGAYTGTHDPAELWSITASAFPGSNPEDAALRAGAGAIGRIVAQQGVQ